MATLTNVEDINKRNTKVSIIDKYIRKRMRKIVTDYNKKYNHKTKTYITSSIEYCGSSYTIREAGTYRGYVKDMPGWINLYSPNNCFGTWFIIEVQAGKLGASSLQYKKSFDIFGNINHILKIVNNTLEILYKKTIMNRS